MLFIFALFLLPLSAHAEKWVIAVTEWTPYVCESCVGQGPGISSLRKMLNSAGIEVQFIFLPWARAISEVRRKKADGYYPAWREDLTPDMVLSDAVYYSPVGFVERKDRPLKWEKLEDLKGKRIGVVIDYGNTAAFNVLVNKGVIKTEAVKDDETNIKKVLGRRVDAAFVDVVNAKYLISKMGAETQMHLQVNQRQIANKGLHVVFGKNVKDKADRFNKLLKKAKIQKEIDAYLKAHPPETSFITSAIL